MCDNTSLNQALHWSQFCVIRITPGIATNIEWLEDSRQEVWSLYGAIPPNRSRNSGLDTIQFSIVLVLRGIRSLAVRIPSIGRRDGEGTKVRLSYPKIYVACYYSRGDPST